MSSQRSLLWCFLLAMFTIPDAVAQGTTYRGVIAGDAVDAEGIMVLGQLRVNLVRYFCRPRDIRSTETAEQYFARIEECLARFDQLLPVFAANGIRSIIALDPPTPVYHKEDGLPEQRVFVVPEAQAQFIEGWRQVAAHFAGDDRVLGFDLMNEPASGNVTPGLLDWSELAALLIEVIRGAGATQRIYVQPEFGNPVKLTEAGSICSVARSRGYSSIYASFHFYEPFHYTHQLTGKKKPPSKRLYQKYRELFKRSAQRAAGCDGIYLGEFGVSRFAPKRVEYLKRITAYAEEQGMDWTYHAFREANIWDPEIPDARGRQRALDTLRALFRRNL